MHTGTKISFFKNKSLNGMLGLFYLKQGVEQSPIAIGREAHSEITFVFLREPNPLLSFFLRIRGG
jgi:hypothetical protein